MGKLLVSIPNTQRLKTSHVNSAKNTDTHTGFHVLWGLSIDIMFFFYFTNSIFYPVTLTLPITQTFLHFLVFKKLNFCRIYELFYSKGPKNVPTRSKFTGITNLCVYCMYNNVGNTRYTTHTHTHNNPCYIVILHSLHVMRDSTQD